MHTTCVLYSSEMCVVFIPVVRIHFHRIRKFHFRCNTGQFYQDTTPHDNIAVQSNSIANTRIVINSEIRMSRWINDRPICILQSQWGNRARNSNRMIFFFQFRVTLWTFHYDFSRRSLVNSLSSKVSYATLGNGYMESYLPRSHTLPNRSHMVERLRISNSCEATVPEISFTPNFQIHADRLTWRQIWLILRIRLSAVCQLSFRFHYDDICITWWDSIL